MEKEIEFNRNEVLYTGLYSVEAYKLLDRMIAVIDGFVKFRSLDFKLHDVNAVDGDLANKFWTKYDCIDRSRLQRISKLKNFFLAMNDETHEIIFVPVDNYSYSELMFDFMSEECIMATLGELIYDIVTSVPACSIGLAQNDLDKCKIIASFMMKRDVMKMYDKSLVDEVIGCPNDVVTAESIHVLNDSIRQLKAETASVIDDIRSRYASKISYVKEMLKTLEEQKNVELSNANSSMMYEISKIKMSIGKLNNAFAGAIRQINLS